MSKHHRKVEAKLYKCISVQIMVRELF